MERWGRRHTRHTLLLQMVPRYHEAPASQKRALLDEAVTQTAIPVSMPTGCSIILSRCSHVSGAGDPLAMVPRFNMPSSWPGMQPIASAASGSSPFCPP